MTEQLESESVTPTIAGKWIVIAMGVFGILMTGSVWVYWKLHLGPFLELQTAIAERYKDSRPIVEGGQSKIHKNTPAILRISMKVDYDPTVRTEEVDHLFEEILKLAHEKMSLEPYEQFEFNVYLPKQETELTPIRVQRTRELKTSSAGE